MKSFSNQNNLNHPIILSLIAFLVTAGASFAQEKPKTLEDLYRDWGQLNAQLDEIESKIKSGNADANLIGQRKELLAQSKRLVETLESAARGKLGADRQSRLAYQLLMGISLDAAANDNDAKVLEIGDFLISKGINKKYFQIAAKSDRLSIGQREIFDELQIRYDEAMANDLPRVKLKTTQGEIVIELFENEAPGTVGNFISLCENGFYKDRLFHRVIEGFVAQTGGFRDQETDEGGPGYEIKCECYKPEKRLHFTGSLSMAHRTVRDSGGSQFFITFRRTSGLDGQHTVFGRVIQGTKVLENLERTHVITRFGKEDPIEGAFKDKILSAEVMRKRDHAYSPDKAEKVEPNEQTVESRKADSGSLDLNGPDDVDK